MTFHKAKAWHVEELAELNRQLQLFVARGHRRRGIATTMMDWMYANVWPRAELVIVDDAGHAGGALAPALVRATDRLAVL